MGFGQFPCALRLGFQTILGNGFDSCGAVVRAFAGLGVLV